MRSQFYCALVDLGLVTFSTIKAPSFFLHWCIILSIFLYLSSRLLL